MRTALLHRSTPRAALAATALASLSLGLAPAASRADEPAPNAGQRYVSVGGQADDRHDSNAAANVSLTVGQRAWVQAGVGQSRSSTASGTRSPGIVTGGVGVAGRELQATLNASHRADGGRFHQTDVGGSLEWHRDGHVLGLDLTHRSSRAAGTVAVADGSGGTTSVPAVATVSGNGVGVHGTWQATRHVSVYGAVARNHYHTTTQQVGTASSGGLLGLDPVLSRALLGRPSVVNQDEAALDHSAMAGAAYRWDKVGVAAEYTTGQVHDGGGAVRSVELKAAVDVAPGWRIASGLGRGTTDQGGAATFASLSATYGW